MSVKTYKTEVHATEAFNSCRNDGLNCTSGNKPCGARCIPSEQKCGVGKMIGGALQGIANSYKAKNAKFKEKRLTQIARREQVLQSRNTKRTGRDMAIGAIAGGTIAGPAGAVVGGVAGGLLRKKIDEKERRLLEKRRQRIEKQMHSDSLDLEITTPIAQAITDTFDAPVDEILTLNLDSDLVYGTLLSGGNFYSYSSDGFSVAVTHHDSLTQELNDYTEGLLAVNNVRVDSNAHYDWARGLLRLDGQIKCKSGGVPCGKRCLPKGQTCRKGMGAGSQGAVKGAKTRLKTGGAGTAAKIAAGLVGATGLVGAGYVGYKGKDELAQGGKMIGEEMKRAGNAAKEDLKAGLQQAQESLKAVKPMIEQIGERSKFERKQINESTELSKKQKRIATRGSQYTEGIGKTMVALGGGGSAAASGAIGAEEAARSIGRGVKTSARIAGRTAKAVGKKLSEDFNKKDKKKE